LSEYLTDKLEIDSGKKKHYVRINRDRFSSIILSRRNKHRILTLGRYGETYDQIINRLIDYDIKLREQSTVS